MNSIQNDGKFSYRLVVKFRDQLNLPYNDPEAIGRFFGQDHILPWQDLQQQFAGIKIGKLFTSLEPGEISALTRQAVKADREYSPVDLLSYFFIECPEQTDSDALLDDLSSCENIEFAYRENRPSIPPTFYASTDSPADFLNTCQGYLNPAPGGINAKFAWQMPGGDGRGSVKYIDIEQGWLINHEALAVNTINHTGINHHLFEDHGAAVLGILMMTDKAKDRKGIVPRAKGYIVSQWRPDGSFSNADAILSAIAFLGFGDIILLESQAYDSPSSSNAWPVEIEEATYQVIRLATALGIIVIEAAGNGNLETNNGNDLDLFEIDGKKIFDPSAISSRDSGAIIVAAASAGTPHERMRSSNFGKRINCYAWGASVATAGAWPGISGFAINTYTHKFCGTSSASAIIAGAAISLQSIAEANLSARLGPKQMRNFLGDRSYGTASANGPAIDRIGMMPDLQKIILHALHLRPKGLNSHHE